MCLSALPTAWILSHQELRGGWETRKAGKETGRSAWSSDACRPLQVGGLDLEGSQGVPVSHLLMELHCFYHWHTLLKQTDMSVWYVGGGSSLWTCSCDCMCTHNVYHTHTHTLNICPALNHESGLPKLHISCIDSGTFVAICKQKKKSSIFLKRVYLFFRERGRKGEREGKKHQCVVASHAPPYWGPGPQPRHVP